MTQLIENAPRVYTVPKTRTTAIVLGLFLGGFGAHKFYLREPGWGVLYAALFWTMIPCLVAIIEIILFLCMSDGEFHRQYNVDFKKDNETTITIWCVVVIALAALAYVISEGYLIGLLSFL